MAAENEIIARFTERFPQLTEHMRSPREKRIFTDPLTREAFGPIIRFARDEVGFTRMHHVVGTDDGDCLGFLYILSDADGIMLTLHESAPKSDPVIEAMTPLFPSLEWHERELVDLFGAVVRGLPDGPRYPLPDGWPDGNYPMRKEWDPKRFNKDTMTYEKPDEAEGGAAK